MKILDNHSEFFSRPEYDLEMNGNLPAKVKERKKHDRFNGMPEEEVSKRTLPDHLATNLDIIIVSILFALIILIHSITMLVFSLYLTRLV